MSAPDPVGDGMFDLLDHLPPKPRALYVEKFSKEELLAIVLAVWKERDAARNQATNQVSIVEAAAPHTASDEPRSEKRSPDLSSRAPHLEDPSIGSRKRRHSPEVGGLAEKARKLSIELNRASGSAADRTVALDVIDPTGTGVANSIENHDHDDPDKNTDDEHWPDSSRELTYGASARTHHGSHRKQHMDWEDLPVVLQVPGKHKKDPTIYSIDDAPLAVRRKIHLKWDRVRDFPTYKCRLDAMLRTYRNHLNLATCLRTHIIPLKLKGEGTLNNGGVFKKSACDQCIGEYVPCTYLIELSGNPTLCVVPLPEVLRVGKESTDVGFWVADKK